jgi:transposase
LEVIMGEQVPRVVVGMDPHKRSVTIEVMTADESVVGGGRFDTTVEGYAAMLEYLASWPGRVWAIEGCEGIGRHIAHRLLADGQDIVDVPAKAVCPGAGLRDRAGP